MKNIDFTDFFNVFLSGATIPCSAFILVEITGPILITVTLLQSMHGALPAELNPHSFGVNKKAPHISV